MRVRRILNILFTVMLFVTSILLAIFIFDKSYLRTSESLLDLFDSIKYFFCKLFELPDSGLPSVSEWSNVMVWDTVLPDDVEQFVQESKSFLDNLISKENLKAYGIRLGEILITTLKVSVLILPLILVVVLIIKRTYDSTNTRHNQDTIPLRIFKKISEFTYQKIKDFLRGYIDFLREYSWVWKLLVCIWVFNLNLASIIIAFFAFYFYFAMSYDLSNIYVQFVKLSIDLQTLFNTIPILCFLPLGYHLFNKWRIKIAINKLRKFEARNCGFIKELPIVSITCGSMGKKKTTIITDMALSQEVMFRQKALEILQKTDMKFPYFPWIAFEDDLRACMEHGVVYNLASVKEWIALKRSRYEHHHNANWQLYGYDVARYGYSFNDSLSIKDLFDILEIYAMSYFVYVITSSLLVSNFSIRTDNEMITEGNFPLWCTDFFPEGITEGRHAHILDFDVLRLGKKVIEDNPNNGSFEFGVVVITEIGKERGNNLELKEVKKGTTETNQKNDLFNAWLKMCRHSATIDNFPFIKVFTDEQRPESWGADARDLCDIVNIASSGEQRLALPFYTTEEMITDFVFNKFINLYTDLRYKRGDNTLLVHLIKSVAAWLWRRNIRIYNKYGYSICKIEKERGTMDGKVEGKKYYLMNKKIYARRFSTDCFSGFFNDMARRSRIGMNDYKEYVTEKATVEELKLQNSYFINALYKDTEVA